jgi:DHA1 family multidrug resistance protein-like MFS transporter
VWTANLITSIGMMSFLPFFPTHLEQLGLRDRDDIALWAGVIYGAAPLSAALTSPLWGALGDRYGRRLMVLRSMAAIAVFVGAMAFANSVWVLFALRILQGIFSGYLAPSMTLVSVAAPADQQGRVTGSLQTATAAGSIVGPLIGAALASVFEVRWVFLCVAILAVLSGALVLAWAEEDPAHRRRASGEGSLAHAVQGSWRDLRDVWSNDTLRGSLAIVFWIQFAMGTTNPILELHVRDLIVGDALAASRGTSALFSGMAALNLLAMPVWGRYGDRRGHAKALVLCAIASGLTLATQGLATAFWVLLSARLCFGVAMAGSAPNSFGLAAQEAPIDRRGGAFGVVFGVRTLAIALSAMTGGWLSRFVGVHGLMIAGGAVVAWTGWSMRLAAQRRASLRNADGG